MRLGIVSTMEGHRAKLINQQIKDEKVEQNKKYIKKLNKNLENLIYTEDTYNDGIDSSRLNKYYYTNVYDVYEKTKIKKVGNKGKNRAYLTAEKNRYKNSKSRKFSNGDILDKNFSGFASDFYDEDSVRLNQKLKSYGNLKKQAERMYTEVIKSNDYKWPCTLITYKKDAWGRKFQYIRDKDNQVKIGYSLPWNKNKKTFLTLKLPELSEKVVKKGIKKIVVNYDFVYILTNNGTVYVEGDFRFSKETGGFTCPLASKIYWECENKLIKLPLGNVINIWTEGSYSSAYVVIEYENGDLYVTGANGNGKLGLGHKNDVKQWTKTFDKGIVKDIKIDNAYSYILTNSEELYVIGKNIQGQLGVGHKDPVTTWVKTWDKGPIKSFSIGTAYSYILTKSGELYVAGKNKGGQLGLGHSNNVNSWEKVKIDNVEEADIDDSSYLITKSRELYLVGKNNAYGKLGVGHTKNLKDWTKINIGDVDKVNLDNNSYVITKFGDLYVTGQNNYGGLGFGTVGYKPSWTKVNISNIKDFSIGDQSGILTESGDLYVTGRNNKGQLGLGHKNNILKWTKIDIPNVDEFFILASSYLMTKDRSLYLTGNNNYNQLGFGHKKEVIKWTKSKDNVQDYYFYELHYNANYILLNNGDLYSDNNKISSNIKKCIFLGCGYVQDFNGTIFKVSPKKLRIVVKNLKDLDYMETKYSDIVKKITFNNLGNRQILFLSTKSPPRAMVRTLPEEDAGSYCN